MRSQNSPANSHLAPGSASYRNHRCPSWARRPVLVASGPDVHEAHASPFRVRQHLLPHFQQRGWPPSPSSRPSPPPHLLLGQRLHCACLQCGPFLETVPCHYLSPSKFQFVVPIPSNCIQSKRASWLSALSPPYTRHDFPPPYLRPISHRLIAPHQEGSHRGHPGTSPASLCRECPGTQGGPQAGACLFTGSTLAHPPGFCGSRGASRAVGGGGEVEA